MTTFCPYVGLQPYTDGHAAYFFGRERDQRIVAANLYAAPLSVLYGATGAGKSSLLLAGVVPRLRERGGTAVVTVREWQGRDALAALKTECANAVRGQGVELDSGLRLDELLLQASEAIGGPMYLVLDQFEEYFVSRPRPAADDPFEAELARAVNTPDLDAAVLISLREDALAGLDRFRRRIPGLLANTIRLRHLSPAAAESAIREPLKVYNREFGASVGIEDGLVDELLEQVRVSAGRSLLTAPAGTGGTDDESGEIEAPFLQLVLERLWSAEVGAGSSELRLKTFRDLGGARGIVARHFDSVVDGLTARQRELCSRFFDRLVTGSGGKIAYPVDDLAGIAGPLAGEVPATLDKLTHARILRRVELPAGPAVEIFHDVLAPTILNWQQEFVRLRERALERRKLRRRLLQAAAAAAVVLAFFGYRYYTLWLHNRPWGTLTDLATGKAHKLAGYQVSVGRNVPGYYENQVGVPAQAVSRIHLTVFRRSRRAIDMRSLNGTTVNARFLKYGDSTSLHPGDIVVLAGSAPFRFEPVHYSRFQFWTPSVHGRDPAPGWGILVDGRARATRALTRSRYFLSVRGGRLVVRDRPTAGWLVHVDRTREGRATIEDRRDATPLRAQGKEENSETYPVSTLQPGIPYFPGAAVFWLKALPFQVIEVR